MNPLQRSLIEKAGHDFGFEYVADSDDTSVALASARHSVKLCIALYGAGYAVAVSDGPSLVLPELKRDFSITGNSFFFSTQEGLAQFLRRAASLGRSLPNAAKSDYEQNLKKALGELPDNIRGTEAERVVRQRVGQDAFRKAMMDYWGGACAVTGVELAQVLKASHAKPWALCTDDTERLDVFNGFLLSANLDALFDKGLISFDDLGGLLVNNRISPSMLQKLGIEKSMALRWLTDGHFIYLRWHRKNIFS